MSSCPDRDGSGKLRGHMVSKAVRILNSRTGVEGEGFVGGGNRMSKVLVAWKIWSVYREE